MTINPDDYLHRVLDSHGPAPEHARPFLDKGEALREALAAHFGHLLYPPFACGATAKGTAIRSKLDLDLAAPFRRAAFGSPAEMYEAAHAFLKAWGRGDPEVAGMSRQRRAINLVFRIGGREADMDLVPGLECRAGSYPPAGDLELHDLKAQAAVRTNVHVHIAWVRGRGDRASELRREVMRLLRVWKAAHFPSLSSFLLELLVLRAFEDLPDLYGKGLFGRVLGVSAHVAERLGSLRLADPANPGNVVSDTLRAVDRRNLAEALEGMVRELEGGEGRLGHFFGVGNSNPL